jgi:pilus assembly protein Flp/PilA
MDFLGVTQVEVFMSNLISRFVRDESGATAIEYGLIAALVAVAIITALTTLGTNLSSTFSGVSNKLTAAPAAG